MPGTYSRILLHTVFSTKDRANLITPTIQPELYAYMGGIVRDMKGVLFEIGGIANHVHMLVRWRTDESVAALMREVKSGSSHWVHAHRGMAVFGWQEGYSAFSVSESQKEVVANYIRSQIDHHRARTYEEELLVILRVHQIEFDEKYLWG